MLQDVAGYRCDIPLPFWGLSASSVPMHLVAVSTLLSLSWRILLMMMVVIVGILMVQQTDVHHKTVKMRLLDRHHRFVVLN